MLYEIDFLPVGEASSSGDAICLRYSADEGASWHVGVIDGGTQTSGEALCQHIKDIYKTEVIDFVICTHPDQDHASGLSVVLEQLTVKKVLLHCPWDYIDAIYDKVSDGRVTKESLKQRLIDGHPYAYKLYEQAVEKQIPITHPFSDFGEHDIPCLNIVGPSVNFYIDQVVNFRSITEITEDKSEDVSILQSILSSTQKAISWLSESWDDEKLVDPADDATSSENNSSVICLFDFDGIKSLLTADAGSLALIEATDKIEELGHDLQSFSFIQIPHHGSKRNIGPTVLNRLIGPPLSPDASATFTAFISSAKEGEPKHPNKRVVNAFKRRGGKVIATQGSSKCHHSGAATNRGWSTAEPLPFYTDIEDDD